MVLQVGDTAPLVHAGSDRVLDREARSSDRLAWSFPIPSWRISNEELTFSKASLVSRMAKTNTSITVYFRTNVFNQTSNIFYSQEKGRIKTLTQLYNPQQGKELKTSQRFRANIWFHKHKVKRPAPTDPDQFSLPLMEFSIFALRERNVRKSQKI